MWCWFITLLNTMLIPSCLFKMLRKYNFIFLTRTCIRPVVVYGGTNTIHSIRQVMQGCNILCATPGRLLDIIGREKVGAGTRAFLNSLSVKFMALIYYVVVFVVKMSLWRPCTCLFPWSSLFPLNMGLSLKTFRFDTNHILCHLNQTTHQTDLLVQECNFNFLKNKMVIKKKGIILQERDYIKPYIFMRNIIVHCRLYQMRSKDYFSSAFITILGTFSIECNNPYFRQFRFQFL